MFLRLLFGLICFLPVLLIGQNRQLMVNLGLADEIYKVKVSPDGRHMAATDEETIKIWELPKGRLVTHFVPDKGYIYDFKYRPDGDLITVFKSGYENTFYVHNVTNRFTLLKDTVDENSSLSNFNLTLDEEGKYLAILYKNSKLEIIEIQNGESKFSLNFPKYHSVLRIGFSNDGKYIATTEASDQSNYEIKIRNLNSGKILHAFPCNKASRKEFDFRFHPDGNSIATSLPEGGIAYYNLTTSKQIWKLEREEGIEGFTFTNDGKYLAFWTEFSIQFIDINTGKVSINPGWHDDYVNAVTHSPDGKFIITASDDKTAKIWDASSLELIHTIDGHQDAVEAAIYSPNGKHIATASSDKIKIWREKNFKLSNTMTDPKGAISNLCFSPDSKYLASGNYKGSAMVWEVKSGKLLQTLTNYSEKIISELSFSPEGNYLAVREQLDAVTVWNLKTGKVARKLEDGYQFSNMHFQSENELITALKDNGHLLTWDIQTGQIKNTVNPNIGWSPYRLALFPELQKYVVAKDNFIQILNTQTGESIQHYEIDSEVYNLDISPDGSKLVAELDYGQLAVWDIQSGIQIRNIGFNLFGDIEDLCFSPNDKWLVAGSDEMGHLEVFAFPEMEKKLFIPGEGGINDLRFSPDGKSLIVSEYDKNKITIWDIKTMKPIRELPGHAGGTGKVAISNNGKMLASFGRDNLLKFWSIYNGKLENQIAFPKTIASYLEFSPNGKWLAACFNNKKTLILDAFTGEIIKEFQITDIWVNAHFNKNGTKLAICNRSNFIEIYETGSWNLIQEIQSDKSIGRFSFSNDEKYVISSGSIDYYFTKAKTVWTTKSVLFVWEVASGKLVHTIIDSEGYSSIYDFDLSPDGTQIITVGASRKLNFWDLETGNLVYSLPAHDLGINNVCYSPNGNLIASGGDDNLVKIWDVSSKQELVSAVTFEKGKGWAAISPEGKYTANTTGLKHLNYSDGKQAYDLPSNDPNRIDAFDIPVSTFLPTQGMVSAPIVQWINRPKPIIQQNNITLQAKIESEGPLFTHYVFHNDQRIFSTYNPATQMVICTINALPGADNTVYIEAVNQGGSVTSSPVQFKFAPINSRKSYALIFAVENYDDTYSWQPLPNVLSGARKLKAELENNYGFEVELLPNPTYSKMETAIRKYSAKTYNPQDQFLLFFTGHGDIQKRGNSNVGYLVASDAKMEGNLRINYFRHSDLALETDGIACPHVLVVLDACFSSTFGTSINNAITGANPKGTFLQPQLDEDQQIQEILSKRSRLYMSSGSSETLGGTKNKASPFFEEFLKALQNRNNKKDGMVSFDEIKLDIMRARLRPEPKGGRFGSHEAEGTFLFIQEK